MKIDGFTVIALLITITNTYIQLITKILNTNKMKKTLITLKFLIKTLMKPIKKRRVSPLVVA